MAQTTSSHQLEQVDGRMASELALDVRDRHNVQNLTAHRSLILATGNALASKVELCPQGNPDLLAEMVSFIREQAACIQELE